MNCYYFKRTIAVCFLLAANAVCALAQQWLTAGPYLQELTSDGVTVVFEHGIPSLSWIEVREAGSTETTNYYQTVDGQIQVQRQILDANSVAPVQNFAIRAEGLKPNTTYQYRVRGRKINSLNANGATMSMGVADNYSSGWNDFTTIDPNRSEHHLFITSDMHNRPDTLAALLRHLDYKTIDHFFYNGDMTNYVQVGANAEDPYRGYINTSVELFARHKPFEMVRGNHDTRGNISRHFKDYFPRRNGQIYSASRWGDLKVIMLDSGEDKVDDHAEYFGLAAFYKYREEQAEWLKQVIKSEEFRTAKYRIVICHFPILVGNKRNDEFDGQPHLSSLILPLLKQCDIDLYVSGHYHPATYQYFGENYNGQGNKFDEYIVGAHTAMRIDIEGGNIRLRVVDHQGNVLLDKGVKDPKADQKTVFITTKE